MKIILYKKLKTIKGKKAALSSFSYPGVERDFQGSTIFDTSLKELVKRH
jgi:hypothetical protein